MVKDLFEDLPPITADQPAYSTFPTRMKPVLLAFLLFAGLTLALHPKISSTLWQELSSQPNVDFLVHVKNPLKLEDIKDEAGKSVMDIENIDLKAKVIVSQVCRVSSYYDHCAVETACLVDTKISSTIFLG